MSSLRNAVSRRAHKERAQPESRKKFGLLEKHKDYVERAKAYHKKEETLRILKQKAFYRNPDEFNFKMIKTRTVNGVHKLESQANKYTPEELMLMKTQDIGYIFQKVQSEKKKIEKLTATHCTLLIIGLQVDTFTLPKTERRLEKFNHVQEVEKCRFLRTFLII